MNLREALEILGPDRVRLGIAALDVPYQNLDSCACFVGRAFGGGREGYCDATRHVGPDGRWNDGEGLAPLNRAARLVEGYYEGGGFGGIVDRPRRETWPELRAECVAFLAEHGSATEPSLIVSGKSSQVAVEV